MVALLFGSVTIWGWVFLGLTYVSGLILIHMNEDLIRDIRAMEGIFGIVFGAIMVICWPISFIAVFVIGFILECFQAGFSAIGALMGQFLKLTRD